jgi:hypothetical protein
MGMVHGNGSWEWFFFLYSYWLMLNRLLNVFFLFLDCKGLFLRHTESGKCIAAGEMFLENNIARRYWAEMVNNCFNVSASFRYLDTELLQNIDTRGTLASFYDNPERYKNRWFVYKGKNDRGLNFEKEDSHRLKQTVAESLYFYDKAVNSCGQPNGTYLDLKRDGCSNTPEQKFTFGKSQTSHRAHDVFEIWYRTEGFLTFF